MLLRFFSSSFLILLFFLKFAFAQTSCFEGPTELDRPSSGSLTSASLDLNNTQAMIFTNGSNYGKLWDYKSQETLSPEYVFYKGLGKAYKF